MEQSEYHHLIFDKRKACGRPWRGQVRIAAGGKHVYTNSFASAENAARAVDRYCDCSLTVTRCTRAGQGGTDKAVLRVRMVQAFVEARPTYEFPCLS